MDFDWIKFIDAFALVFIIEGIMPFIKPDAFKKYLDAMRGQPDNFLRIMGLISMLFGLLVLTLVRIFFDI